jgi:hypothetical protein
MSSRQRYCRCHGLRRRDGGLGVLREANVGKRRGEVDAETTPLHQLENCQYELNVRDVTEVWRRGSVIASWLLNLTAAALVEDQNLSKYAGRVSDSSEGRWTIKATIDEGLPAPVLSAALYERQFSRGADYQDKLLSAMRYQFGGISRSPLCRRRRGDVMSDTHSDGLSFSEPLATWHTKDFALAVCKGQATQSECAGDRSCQARQSLRAARILCAPRWRWLGCDPSLPTFA